MGTSEKWGRTGLALSFTLLAAATAWALWRRAPWLRVVVAALAGWTVGVWIVRAVGIATGDHEAAFIAVHLVLALVSIALSAWAWHSVTTEPIASRWVRSGSRRGRGSGSGSRLLP